jgi:hypothetical protein
LSTKLKFTLNSVVVTHLVDFDTFPEWYEESMKGDGYFEFEVKPFVFTLITIGTDIVPARGDWVEIIEVSTGESLLKGKIDEILGADSSLPEITVFPQALILKDLIIGDTREIVEGEIISEYHFGVRSIKNTLTDIIRTANTLSGSSMRVSDISCPPSTVEDGHYIGDMLEEYGTLGGTFIEISTEVYIRASFGVYYLINKISNSSYAVSRLEGGSMTYQDTYNTDETFGTLLFNSQTAENVTEEQITEFAGEHGLVSNVYIATSFDYDSGASYALVFGQSASGSRYRALILSFSTTFNDEYSGTYRNATAMTVIRDLAVASNRWFYVDRTGLVYLLPRASSRGSISLTTGKTISSKKRVRAEQDQEVKINRYSENDDGVATSYGLRLREVEIESIQL